VTSNQAYYDDNYASLLPAARDAAILDLGCGQGDLARYLSDRGYRHVTAIDSDEDCVARLAGAAGVTAKVSLVDPSRIERRRGGWPLIVAKQVIYYFDRREAPDLIASLRDALAPDGRLIVEIFNGALLNSRFTELKDPGILTAYTEHGLRRLLEQNGLVVEQLFGAKLRFRGLRGFVYAMAQSLWFRFYRLLLVIERGRDNELPRISSKTIIAVARRR
jgi:SAM-dependent methyltransferase